MHTLYCAHALTSRSLDAVILRFFGRDFLGENMFAVFTSQASLFSLQKAMFRRLKRLFRCGCFTRPHPDTIAEDDRLSESTHPTDVQARTADADVTNFLAEVSKKLYFNFNDDFLCENHRC